MKTLRDTKPGETVKVVKLNGSGAGKTPYHGYGYYQRR